MIVCWAPCGRHGGRVVSTRHRGTGLGVAVHAAVLGKELRMMPPARRRREANGSEARVAVQQIAAHARTSLTAHLGVIGIP